MSEILSRQHIHDPVEENCTNCHNPHADKSVYQLSAAVPELCFECHPDILQYSKGTHKHDPVDKGQCLKCHNVHASDNPRMFESPLMQLCFSCHEEKKNLYENKEFLHGPFREGDCNACHNPHGSNSWRILHKDFPQQFYAAYEEDTYAICFQCHNQDIVKQDTTTTLTAFRNKNVNLHFRHVNKAKKGRSCRACHEVHASSQERHIRESVPFGESGWALPVKYTKLPDGGKCVVGCHSPKEYHR
ncbi:MAG: cytochrome c3 family protein [candidate division Zixibacteria bacterium]